MRCLLHFSHLFRREHGFESLLSKLAWVLRQYWQREKHGGIWFCLPVAFKWLSKHLFLIFWNDKCFGLMFYCLQSASWTYLVGGSQLLHFSVQKSGLRGIKGLPKASCCVSSVFSEFREDMDMLLSQTRASQTSQPQLNDRRGWTPLGDWMVENVVKMWVLSKNSCSLDPQFNLL